MRKKIIFNLFAVLSLVLYFGLSPLQIVSADTPVEENTEQATTAPSWIAGANYLALGDSLAAGMIHLGAMGDGYADYLANSLSESELLLSFSKAFAENGYTAADVLKDIEGNVTRELADGQSIKLHDAIAQANLITISAGANDVLGHISLDKETGEIKFDAEAIKQEIQQVGLNLMNVVTAIHKINPDAQIYLMGYYNPFPHMPEEIQPMLEQLLVGINTAIATVAKLPNVEWVETANVIAADIEGYLPTGKDIHLTSEGYKVVAKQFLDKVQAEYSWIPADAMVSEEVTTDSVTLQWKPATPKDQVTMYNIYNGDEKIGSVEGDVFTFTVDGLDEGQAYTFSIVAVDVDGNESEKNPSLTVTTEAVVPLFSDIKGHWAEDAIEQAAMLGVFKGHHDGTFKPEDALTRAQAASVFVRALNLPTTDVVAPFDDIGDYAAETQSDIQIAFANGLIKGDNGHFKPTENVTRAQLALMVWRVAANELGGDIPVSNSFTPPTDMGDYDAESVQAISVMSELGVISLEDGAFHPTKPATRAFAASLLTKLLSLTNQ